jgi:hypothetical protein
LDSKFKFLLVLNFFQVDNAGLGAWRSRYHPTGFGNPSIRAKPPPWIFLLVNVSISDKLQIPVGAGDVLPTRSEPLHTVTIVP